MIKKKWYLLGPFTTWRRSVGHVWYNCQSEAPIKVGPRLRIPQSHESKPLSTAKFRLCPNLLAHCRACPEDLDCSLPQLCGP